MAAANPAKSLELETSCSICLDYFQDPVSIECGHNFCRSCITQYWEGLDANFPCPQCRKISPQKTLRPNMQLANVTELTKQLLAMAVRESAGSLCEKHRETLKVFCEDDQTPICMVCSLSRDHRAHTMAPIEEAVQEYKVKIQQLLEWLRSKLGDAETCQSNEQDKTGELKKQVELQRKRIICEFDKLHQLLNEAQNFFLSSLEREEKEILNNLNANISRLTEQSQFLKKQIAEIEEKQQQSSTDFLKGVKSLLSRSQCMNFAQPNQVLAELRMNVASFPYQDIVLTKILKKLKVSAASVILDPETANPHFILSEDRKQVRWTRQKLVLPAIPKRFDPYPCVLGCEGFTSGRHYWEVYMGAGRDCSVGVARESVNRKAFPDQHSFVFAHFFSITDHRKEGIIESPENGIWAVEQSEGRYHALTSPPSPFTPSQAPRKLGVYLDYDGGRLSFYNADSMEHFYTFTASFNSRVFPFFCIWKDGEIRL